MILTMAVVALLEGGGSYLSNLHYELLTAGDTTEVELGMIFGT